MGASSASSVRHAHDPATELHAVVRMAHATLEQKLAPMGRSYR